jgi:hypothetical protein
MTTEMIDNEATPVEEEPHDVAGGPKELRDALKRTQQENAELREILMEDAWAKVGLNPKEGLGKAIAKEYKGKPTAEALAQYAAEEYAWNVPEAPENEIQPQVEQGTQLQERVQSESQPMIPNAPEETRRKAEAEGDWVTAGQIKADKLRKLMRPGN